MKSSIVVNLMQTIISELKSVKINMELFRLYTKYTGITSDDSNADAVEDVVEIKSFNTKFQVGIHQPIYTNPHSHSMFFFILFEDWISIHRFGRNNM